MPKRAPREAGQGRHSPLYIWMWDHYVDLTKNVFGEHGPNWSAMIRFCADAGLLDANGNPPSIRVTQRTYYRVRDRKKRDALATVDRTRVETVKTLRPFVGGEQIERAKKVFDKKSGRK